MGTCVPWQRPSATGYERKTRDGPPFRRMRGRESCPVFEDFLAPVVQEGKREARAEEYVMLACLVLPFLLPSQRQLDR